MRPCLPRRKDRRWLRFGRSGKWQPAIWQGGTNWKLLRGVPGGVPQGSVLSQDYGVSGDGSVVVGIAYLPSSRQLGTEFHGFRWDAVSGMVTLRSITHLHLPPLATMGRWLAERPASRTIFLTSGRRQRDGPIKRLVDRQWRDGSSRLEADGCQLHKPRRKADCRNGHPSSGGGGVLDRDLP